MLPGYPAPGGAIPWGDPALFRFSGRFSCEEGEGPGGTQRLSGKPRVDGRKRLKAKELCQMCVRLTQLVFRQWFAAITSPLLG